MFPPGSESAPSACAFYRRALMALQAAQVPFLVGGGHALAHYTGIIRHTADFDIFVYPHHCVSRSRESSTPQGTHLS